MFPFGVWINDGTGKFERGDSGRYPASIGSDFHSLQSTPLEILVLMGFGLSVVELTFAYGTGDP